MGEPRQAPAYGHPLRLRGLDASAPHAFRLEPDDRARAALAETLGILGLRKVRFEGRLIPEGNRDWRLEAELGATVVQACVATLAPVATRIETPVRRRYLAQVPDVPGDDEVEMPDDEIEPLPAVLDLGAVLAEELALNLPLYPHAEGADPVDETFAAPGVEPLTDDEARPFAGLKGLKQRLERDED